MTNRLVRINYLAYILLDFSNVVTIVPVLPQSVAFLLATSGDPLFIIQVHGRKWSHETRKPASYLVVISHYLAAYYHLAYPQLRWCSGLRRASFTAHNMLIAKPLASRIACNNASEIA